MRKFKDKIEIQIFNYEAIVLREFLTRINSEDSSDEIEQKVLNDLEAALEKLIFRETGTPDVPLEEIIPQARQLVRLDME